MVTGGTGFLGRMLVEHLLRKRERVRVIGRRPVVHWRKNPNVEHIRADITQPGVIEAALAGVDRIYHLAAATHGDWLTYRAVTVDSFARLLESFAARGGGRIVLVSSLGNYDGGAMRDGGVVDEDFPLEQNPQGRGYYARAKVEADRIAQAYLTHPSVKLTIVRPGIVYGPGMKNPLTGVAFSVMGKILVVLGEGDKLVPLIYIDDVVRALDCIMESGRTIGCTYNLVSPQMPTQNQYLALYCKLNSDRRPVVRIPPYVLNSLSTLVDWFMRRLSRPHQQLGYKVSRFIKRSHYTSERLTRDIGFQAHVSLKEGMNRMIRRIEDGQ